MPKIIPITEVLAKNWLANVPDDKLFWCRDGKVISNTSELELALRGMDVETFRFHCNETKCDFANWVQDVIGDEKLARDLRKSDAPVVAAEKVKNRIIFLEERAGIKRV